VRTCEVTFQIKVTTIVNAQNLSYREGRWTVTGNVMLSGNYRVFLGGDRQNKSLSVSSGIVRSHRDGWRTINCAVFVTDERSALSLCPEEGRTNVVAVRSVSVLRTHPRVSPRSSAPLEFI
jgi:hypothetical protein